ncbi:hypothetical protein DLM45_06465 [Hyphomicrobium methylovorum]|uniref:ATP-binding protein n=1 Tax=Hyphomicrobium methylovorum TaxID=84 RepID=UPI0015E6A7F1|nr:ATP-binding protein [Hyphomicrobium methylovorum]MBA2125865.1 hypothetical protein [Hyphomicrobium methylovorum]
MSGAERLEVELQPDTIERLTKARPIAALAEFIWNALDADADNVQVRLERDALDGLSKIVLTDQGTGLSRTDALQQFSLRNNFVMARSGPLTVFCSACSVS